MVTLSHNGELTFFTKLSALDDAIENAENGDIIYLSEGDFCTTTSGLSITKTISIVGCGYKSRIINPIYVSFTNDGDELPGPLFDGVRLLKLNFDASSAKLNELEISRSLISTLVYPSFAAKIISINSCNIENCRLGGGGGRTEICNSKIGYLYEGVYNSSVKNCNIKKLDYLPRTAFSSIFMLEDGLNTSGDHTVFNSLFPDASILDKYSSVYRENCYYMNPERGLLDDNLDCTIDLEANQFFGEDGDVVGIYGGESKFSEFPSVPTVDSAKSSVEYDSENNKLKVVISVAEN